MLWGTRHHIRHMRAALCIISSGFGLTIAPLRAQQLSPGDSAIRAGYGALADSLISAATRDSAAHIRLARLVDTFGPRFSGSSALESAIDWVLKEMKAEGLQNVHGERVMVPHWERGAESGGRSAESAPGN